MPVSAATLALLMDAGLTGDKLVEVVASIDADMASIAPVVDAAAERKRAADRARMQEKPYVPRYDPALATPRLPEKEWWPLRAAVLRRDGFTCVYCSYDGNNLCADHVVPLSRGGSNEMSNLVACCLPCNSSKSDRLLSEWKGRYAS